MRRWNGWGDEASDMPVKRASTVAPSCQTIVVERSGWSFDGATVPAAPRTWIVEPPPADPGFGWSISTSRRPPVPSACPNSCARRWRADDPTCHVTSHSCKPSTTDADGATNDVDRPGSDSTVVGTAAAATLLNFFHPYDAAATDLTVHAFAVALVVGINRALGGRIFSLAGVTAGRLPPN